MENIGEKLMEARKKAGVSLREASEATKVRSDFLAAMEDNGFDDIPLPDIYKLGFLKLYARYLKLDIEKVSATFKRRTMIRTGLPRSGSGREILGTVSLPDKPGAVPAESDSAPISRGSSELFGNPSSVRSSAAPSETARVPTAPRESSDIDIDSQYSDRTLIWKVGLIFLSVFVLIFVLVGIFRLASGSGSSDPVSGSIVNGVAPLTQQGTSQASATSFSTTITAINGPIESLSIVTYPERETLHLGSLRQNERITVSRQGRLMITVNPAQNIRVEEQGRPGVTIQGRTGGVRFFYPE
jgi:cytoskeleton protein RodZ